MKKRFKWEPPALMILVLALGAWLVIAAKSRYANVKPAEGARVVELRMGNARGVIEVTQTGSKDDLDRFRILLRNGFASEPMNVTQFESAFGKQTLQEVTQAGDNFLFKLFNITSWASMAWIAVGFGGQLVFSARFIVQWLASERERRSVVPEAFWWLSLFGGVTMFTYFVWRQDFVGVLGQSSGLVIYGRNIRLIHKQRVREAEATPASE
jgi:lipid-A-disaccharide synthase-like uncharacterized protein